MTETTNPIAHMIGKDHAFDRRSLAIETAKPFPLQRQWTPETALTRTDALGYQVTRVTDLTDLVRWATRQIARDNSNLLALEALLRQPELPVKIAQTIYTKDMQPADLSIPVITFTEFSNKVREAIEKLAPHTAAIPGIVEVIIYTYGRPAIEQGFVLSARDMVNVELATDLVPDYATIKSFGLATLLEHNLEGIRMSFSTLGKNRIAPRLLFESLRAPLTVLCEKFIELRFQWESFDALAAVSIAKLTGYFDDKPDRVAFVKNADVEAFCRNFTLVTEAMKHFTNDRHISTTIPLLAEADAYVHNFRGLVSAVTQSPLLHVVPLQSFIDRTHITRLSAANKLLLALIMEPNFRADPTAQVSYLANTDLASGAVLTPMPEVEQHVRGLYGPLQSVANASVIELHNVIVNTVTDDGEALAAEAGAALLKSAGSEPLAMPAYVYEPDLLTKNMSEAYIQHVGAAHASYIGISDGEELMEPSLTYFFAPTTPDLHYLTTPISEGIAATEDPGLVIALRGQIDMPLARASDAWPTAPQYLSELDRRALLMNFATESFAMFPDIKNSFDRRDRVSLQLTKDVAKIMGSELLTVDVSIFELFGGPLFPDNANVVQVHFNPVMSMQTVGVLSLLVSLHDRSYEERGRHATIAAAIHLLQPLLQSREFQIAYRSLLTRFAALAKTPSQRLFFSRSLRNVYDVADLQIRLAFLLMLRTRLMTFDDYQEILESPMWTSPAFRMALSTTITA